MRLRLIAWIGLAGVWLASAAHAVPAPPPIGAVTERAEQEVSAFATVELFSRLCAADVKSVLPKTCALLEGQDNGANPIGLGLLKRTVVRERSQHERGGRSSCPGDLLAGASRTARTKGLRGSREHRAG